MDDRYEWSLDDDDPWTWIVVSSDGRVFMSVSDRGYRADEARRIAAAMQEACRVADAAQVGS